MIETTTLPNGLRVISRHTPGTRSAALGLWLVNGGRHQSAAEAGYAHLLEHLLFRRSGALDTLTLSQRFEAMGGQINAHTGRELTALHGLVPAARVTELLELFMRMLTEPCFGEDDLALEREVVREEMAMLEDLPEEAIEEYATERAWPDHPLGWPLLGREEVLARATAGGMRDYLERLLVGRRLLVVGSGAVNHGALVAACAPLAALAPGELPRQTPPVYRSGRHVAKRELAQEHLLWVMPTPAVSAPAFPAYQIANYVLGGGVASRLFHTLRERLGLVYGVQSHLEPYSDAGLWQIQTSCAARQLTRCRAAVAATVDELAADGPTEQELRQAHDHMRAGMMIEEDNPEANMDRMARDAVMLGRVPSLEERLAALAGVRGDQVRAVLAEAWAKRTEVRWGRGR